MRWSICGIRQKSLGILTAIFLAVAPSSASALNCPPAPQQYAYDFYGAVDASVRGLSSYIGQLGFSAKAEVATNNLYASYPNADRLVIAQLLISLLCQMLNESAPYMDAAQKFQIFNESADRVIALALGTQAGAQASQCLVLGRVFDKDTNRPLANITVGYNRRSADANDWVRSVKSALAATAPDGTFAADCSRVEPENFPLRLTLSSARWPYLGAFQTNQYVSRGQRLEQVNLYVSDIVMRQSSAFERCRQNNRSHEECRSLLNSCLQAGNSGEYCVQYLRGLFP